MRGQALVHTSRQFAPPHIVPAPVNESTTRAITNRLIGRSAQVRALCYLARTYVCFIRGFANFRSFVSRLQAYYRVGARDKPRGRRCLVSRKGLGSCNELVTNSSLLVSVGASSSAVIVTL